MAVGEPRPVIVQRTHRAAAPTVESACRLRPCSGARPSTPFQGSVCSTHLDSETLNAYRYHPRPPLAYAMTPLAHNPPVTRCTIQKRAAHIRQNSCLSSDSNRPSSRLTSASSFTHRATSPARSSSGKSDRRPTPDPCARADHSSYASQFNEAPATPACARAETALTNWALSGQNGARVRFLREMAALAMFLSDSAAPPIWLFQAGDEFEQPASSALDAVKAKLTVCTTPEKRVVVIAAPRRPVQPAAFFEALARAVE